MMLRVNEIFYSIQGESAYAGMPCVFIRLSGCNLRCRYCDTAYAYHEGSEIPIPDIVKKAAGFHCQTVEVTGGEPLIQKNTPDLIDMLVKKGFKVLLETNGSMDISQVHPECVKIVDIKCPSSNESHAMDLENLKRLTTQDQVKFVIADKTDYLYAGTCIEKACGHLPPGNILLSPVYGKIDPRELAEWILKDRLQVRLQLQLHKILWPADQRGV